MNGKERSKRVSELVDSVKKGYVLSKTVGKVHTAIERSTATMYGERYLHHTRLGENPTTTEPLDRDTLQALLWYDNKEWSVST